MEMYTSVATDDVCARCEYTISGHSRTFAWSFSFTVADCSLADIVSRVYREFYLSASRLNLPVSLLSFSIKSIHFGKTVIL